MDLTSAKDLDGSIDVEGQIDNGIYVKNEPLHLCTYQGVWLMTGSESLVIVDKYSKNHKNKYIYIYMWKGFILWLN